MDRLLPGVAPQETFPRDDLTEDNTLLLELMLQNKAILQSMHEQTEATIQLYMASHACLQHMARHFNKDYLAIGLNLGAATFEVTSVFVQPRPTSYQPLAVAAGTSSLILKEDQKTVDVCVAARDELRTDCPNLAYVVTEVANRRSSRLSEAALAGAGLMRRSELMTQQYDYGIAT